MDLKENLSISFDALRGNKMRSILTTLGIVIGVTTIIGMMSIIQGLQNFMVQELSVLGSNTFQIQKNPPIQMGRLDEKYRNRKRITLDQAMAVKKHSSLVKAVGPEVWYFGEVIRYRKEKTNPDILIIGATPEFQAANNYFVGEGRFLNETDVEHNRKVVVLGMDIVETLFPHSDPVGQYIRVGAHKMKVIGALEKQGSLFGQSRDNRIIVPVTTFQNMYGERRSLSVTVQVKNPKYMQQAMDQVIGILRAVRKVPPGEPNDFEIFTSESLINTFNDMSFSVKIAAIGIALISLLVGGIGIMNIMLVSVTERTREIGIRKAVGAKRKDILWQFVIESIILGNIGGVLGIILGIIIGLFIGLVTPLPTAIPVWAVFLGIGFCSLVGLFFGIYPAVKAARLAPIVALRHE